jgi:hypothetical protein
MKDYWGGFMKKRISCKVIKSIPLGSEDLLSSHGNTLNIRNYSPYFNFLHVKSRPVIYTKTMKIEKEPFNNYLAKPFIDFYA